MEGALILPQGFRKEMQKLQEPKLFSHEEQFLHYGFQWKKCAKAFDARPAFEIVKTFSITDNIVSTVKLFAGDTSIFSAVNDASISADKLNDLQKISEWVCKWKMSFNPDLRSDFFQKTKRIKLPQNLF